MLIRKDKKIQVINKYYEYFIPRGCFKYDVFNREGVTDYYHMCDLGVPQPRARSSGTKETISVGNFHIIARFNRKYIRKVPVFRGNKVIIYHCGKTNIFSGQVINPAGPLANIGGKIDTGG